MPMTQWFGVTLEPLGGAPRASIDRLVGFGARGVQLSASQPGLRPRELDRSGRRDLQAFLGRRSMHVTGIDQWIPLEHFTDPARVDRAAEALRAALELAADLGRCPVTTALPADAEDVWALVLTHAERWGVVVADAGAGDPRHHPACGKAFDPVASLAAGADPVDAVVRSASSLVAPRLADLSTAGFRAPIGRPDGRLDVDAYLAAVAMCPRARSVVLDARQWTDPWSGVDASLRVAEAAGGRRLHFGADGP